MPPPPPEVTWYEEGDTEEGDTEEGVNVRPNAYAE